MKYYLSFLFLILCTSCSSRLSVQTDYLTRERLASYYVGTPDPNLNKPLIGQRLLITWTLSKEDLKIANLYLHIKIRLRNREEIEVFQPITCLTGYYIYSLPDSLYLQSGGLLTYKVDLIGDEIVIESWQHPLWGDLIKIQLAP